MLAVSFAGGVRGTNRLSHVVSRPTFRREEGSPSQESATRARAPTGSPETHEQRVRSAYAGEETYSPLTGGERRERREAREGRSPPPRPPAGRERREKREREREERERRERGEREEERRRGGGEREERERVMAERTRKLTDGS